MATVESDKVVFGGIHAMTVAVLVIHSYCAILNKFERCKVTIVFFLLKL
jgi:hypothetical protein